jgi:heme exporter protein D
MIEAVATHPWAAFALAIWSLFVLSIASVTLQECVALLVTRERATQTGRPTADTTT